MCVYAHTNNTYLHVSTYICMCLANGIKYTSSRVYDLLIISRRSYVYAPTGALHVEGEGMLMVLVLMQCRVGK